MAKANSGPQRLEDVEAYAAAQVVYQRVNAQLDAAVKAESALLEKAAQPRPRQADVVAAILDGAEVEQAEELGRELQVAQSRVELLRRAEREGGQRLRDAQAQASRLICAARRGEWLAHAQKVAGVLVELGQAVEAELAFRNAMRAEGVESDYFNAQSPGVAAPRFGAPVDPYGQLAQALRALRDAGAIKAGSIPWEWGKFDLRPEAA